MYVPLRKKLAEKGLSSTRELDQDGWKGDFLFSYLYVHTFFSFFFI